MKTMKILLLGTAYIAVALSIQAQEKPKTTASNPALINQWLREKSPRFEAWDIGGQFRLRLEHKENFAAPGASPTAVDFRDVGGNDGNTYLLLREKFHLGYTPCDWLTVFGEVRNSSSHNDDRNPNPESDFLDLHQAWLALGNHKEFPITAKTGRQELRYGDERLIGSFDWNNIGRVFDAAKVRFENEHLWLDGFVSRVVMVDDNNFNVANDYDVFSGLYASSRSLIPKQETELYILARNVGAGSPTAIGAGLPPFMTGASPRDIYTLGLRIKSSPGQFSGWDYEAELAAQTGNFKAAPGGSRLDHQAFAAHVAGGYTFERISGTPRFGLEYNFASGDDNPADGEHGTFENLFPTNHKFYGYMDFVSWQNIHNFRITSSIKPLKKLTLTADYHAFWLADENDFFYQANGAPRAAGGYGINPGAGSYIGSEIDFIATYNFTFCASVQAGYGHFFVGEYVKNSLASAGGSTDADFVYLQMVFNF